MTTHRTIDCDHCRGTGSVPDPAIYIANVRCVPNASDPSNFEGEACEVKITSHLVSREPYRTEYRAAKALDIGNIGRGVTRRIEVRLVGCGRDDLTRFELLVMAAFPELKNRKA